MLSKFGYSLSTTETLPTEVYSLEQINSFNELNSRMQQEARQNASKGDLEHRSKQEDILQKIKERVS